jgi:hypothetical protein
MFNNSLCPYDFEELTLEQQKVILEELTLNFVIPESLMIQLKQDILVSNIKKFIEEKTEAILKPKKAIRKAKK